MAEKTTLKYEVFGFERVLQYGNYLTAHGSESRIKAHGPKCKKNGMTINQKHTPSTMKRMREHLSKECVQKLQQAPISDKTIRPAGPYHQ